METRWLARLSLPSSSSFEQLAAIWEKRRFPSSLSTQDMRPAATRGTQIHTPYGLSWSVTAGGHFASRRRALFRLRTPTHSGEACGAVIAACSCLSLEQDSSRIPEVDDTGYAHPSIHRTTSSGHPEHETLCVRPCAIFRQRSAIRERTPAERSRQRRLGKRLRQRQVATVSCLSPAAFRPQDSVDGKKP